MTANTLTQTTTGVSIHKPSRLEVWITLLAGTLVGSTYSSYVNRLNLKGNERVLDFGSGSGNPALYLAPKLLAGDGRLTCLDVSRTWMELCRRRLSRYANVDCRLGDICTLNLPDAAYDVIFIHFVLYDIEPHQRPAAVAALARRLAKAGRICIREPLRFIDQVEFRTRMRAADLREISALTMEVPTQGTAYEGTYCF